MMKNTQDNERYALWLGFLSKMDPLKYKRILEMFDDDPKSVFEEAAKGKLPPVKDVDSDTLESICHFAKEGFIDKCLNKLDKLNIKAVSKYGENYPELLLEIYDPPPVLYYRGTLRKHINLPLAFIGTRTPSAYGEEVTRDIAYDLSCAGACIVSGMAYGLDALASKAALENKDNEYPTVAVLGSGVDVIYPQENRKLYNDIIERGAVISECPPGTRPLPQNFPKRNRIISGMSRGVIVAEAKKKSGTLITANCALEQGRDVFAVPGKINSLKSEGTNLLIRDGAAKLILSAEDVLIEYGEYLRENNSKNIDVDKLNEEQKLVCELLEFSEMSFDELCHKSGIEVAKLNSILTELEFLEIIKQLPGRIFSL